MVALVGAIANCQPSGASKLAQRRATVDDRGVLRWAGSETEGALFGVNYTAMFAFGYRALGYAGASRERTIDQDLAHLARLGVDGVRLCLWGDWELTDREGNLLNNEHLRLTDYFIAKARARGLSILLTPIVTYSAQWPEPEEDRVCQGFSSVYSRAELATNADARQAQERYLRQLMEHVNPYTGYAYRDEPAIAVVELINEPVSPGSQAGILAYVEGLAKAVRDTGCRKPLFYNVSQGMWDGLVNALRESRVEGATFGWYPTGLVAGHSLRGNFLPKVDDYPQMRDPGLAGKAKLVYEFDAADVPGSYMYPAMARTFRSGGAQWATMFSYDPLPLAPSNTEYQTHYLNLVYTPNKAISLLIAGEAFRRLPRGEPYGRYPENARFGPFRVSYEEDLSELVTERELLYSNDTQTQPPKPDSLERVVGCGSSPVVSYEGTGSYFLEKLEAGVWRLEVYPDAVWVRDPHGRPCLDREVSRIIWRGWPMQVRLPDLGRSFRVEPLNEGNSYRAVSGDGSFSIRAGVYLLVREGASASKWRADSPFGRLKLGEFVAPPDQQQPPVVVHEPPQEVVAGQPFTVRATVVSNDRPARVTLHVRSSAQEPFQSLAMVRERGYWWAAQVRGEWVKTGRLEYCISLQLEGRARTYPADVAGEPGQPGFALPEPTVLYAPRPSDAPPSVEHGGLPVGSVTARIVPGSRPETAALAVIVTAFGEDGSAVISLPRLGEQAIRPEWRGDTAVLVRARAAVSGIVARVELDERDGSTYACDVPVTQIWHGWRMPLRNFHPLKGSQMIRQVDVSRLDSSRIVIRQRAENSAGEAADSCEMRVESVSLEPMMPVWATQVARATDPVRAFDAESDYEDLERRATWGYREQLVTGNADDKLALRIGGRGAGHRDVVIRHWFGNRLGARSGCPASLVRALRLTARAVESPAGVQIALGDDHGAVWGTAVRLATDWQELRLPLSELLPMKPPQVPHPWPLPLSAGDATSQGPVKVGLSTLYVSLRPGLFADEAEQGAAIELQEVALEMSPPAEAEDKGGVEHSGESRE